MTPHDELRQQLRILEVPYHDTRSDAVTFSEGERLQWYARIDDDGMSVSAFGLTPKRAALVIELAMRGCQHE